MLLVIQEGQQGFLEAAWYSKYAILTDVILAEPGLQNAKPLPSHNQAHHPSLRQASLLTTSSLY